MAYDEQLAERVRKLTRRRKGFAEKNMFGGVGFLLHGNMCVGIWKDSLVVRFNRDDHDSVMRMPHVRPFDITGKVMRGWALVDPAGVRSDADLQEWLDTAAEFARTLPRK